MGRLIFWQKRPAQTAVALGALGFVAPGLIGHSEKPAEEEISNRGSTVWQIDPWLASGVMASTAATDAVYVMLNAAVSSRRRVPAATWSSIWYLLSAFAVISYTRIGSMPASQHWDRGSAHTSR